MRCPNCTPLKGLRPIRTRLENDAARTGSSEWITTLAMRTATKKLPCTAVDPTGPAHGSFYARANPLVQEAIGGSPRTSASSVEPQRRGRSHLSEFTIAWHIDYP